MPGAGRAGRVQACRRCGGACPCGADLRRGGWGRAQRGTGFAVGCCPCRLSDVWAGCALWGAGGAVWRGVPCLPSWVKGEVRVCAEGRRLGERHPSGRGGVAVRGLPAGAARRRGGFGGRSAVWSWRGKGLYGLFY